MRCPACNGLGWRPDGDTRQGGMLTGTQQCPFCRGAGHVSKVRVQAAIHTLFRPVRGRTRPSRPRSDLGK